MAEEKFEQNFEVKCLLCLTKGMKKGCVCVKNVFFFWWIDFWEIDSTKRKDSQIDENGDFLAFMDSIFMICEFVSFQIDILHKHTPIFVSERKKGSRFVWNNFHLSSLQFFPKILKKLEKKARNKRMKITR